MIQRFNFYDIYAYVVPGLALLAGLWIPFGLLGHGWPSFEVSTAVAALFLAYFAGLIVHEVSRGIPLFLLRPLPSSLLLDDEDRQISKAMKQLICERLNKLFCLNVAGSSRDEATNSARRDAFLMARHFLVHTKRGAYVEQFQGMYGLMRGGCVSNCFSAAWYAGWLWYVFFWLPGTAPRLKSLPLFSGLLLVFGVPLVSRYNPRQWAREKGWKKWVAKGAYWFSFGSWSLTLFFGGRLFASVAIQSSSMNVSELGWKLVLPLLLALVVGYLSRQAYRDYTRRFAEEVYHALAALPEQELLKPPKDPA